MDGMVIQLGLGLEVRIDYVPDNGGAVCKVLVGKRTCQTVVSYELTRKFDNLDSLSRCL